MNKLLSMVAILALSSVGAMAAGTAVNTEVKNTATLNFNVGGVAQTEVTSNEDSFVVDKKIDFLLTHDADPKHLIVVANKQDAQRSFTLTNESNDVQKYSLSVSNLVGDTYDSKVDSAEMQNLEISIDGGTTWVVGPVSTADIAVDGTLTVLVRGDVLASATDGEIMNVQLEATAVKTDGTTEVSTATADNQAVVDTVLAEGTSGASDFANTGFDGKYSAWAGYLINTPNVDLTKLSCVFSDAVTTDATKSKRIPGATVVYVFDLNNTSNSQESDKGKATGITLTDTLDANYDTSGTVASAKAITGVTSACTCTYGDAEGGNGGTPLNGDATLNTTTNELTLANLSVDKNSHTCVSINVVLNSN